jgi:Ca-activated chloride channel family protein
MREVVTEPTERTGQTHFEDGKHYEIVRGAKSKLDIVIESQRGILTDPDTLVDSDRHAHIHIDDRAGVVVPITEARDRRRLISAAEELSRFSGGTHMGAGMREAISLLQPEAGSKRMILLSDGQTFDEDVVRNVSEELFQNRIPLTAIGVGDDWNEPLLTEIADRTQGQVMDVVPDIQDPQPPSIRASDLPQHIMADIRKAGKEVVTDMSLSVRAVKDVVVNRITRVFPLQSEVDASVQPYLLGNAEAGDETVYVLEFTLPSRKPARMRIAQLGLTYQVPGANYRGELLPQDVVVEYTQNEALAAQVNEEVMQYVKQRNIEGLIKRATLEARTNPIQAQKTMELARSLTVNLGNSVMTQALDRAIGELGSSKTISIGTAKTLRIGSKTQTMKIGDDPSGIPSEEEIRRLTGE